MANPVLMPKQGQSVETCIITEWYKKVGDKVVKGDILFAYETDKASFEEECKEEGVLLARFFEEGDEVPVLTNVAVIGKEGESVAEFTPGNEKVDQKESSQETVVKEEVPHVPESETKTEFTDRADTAFVAISPRARNLAEKHGIDYRSLKGSGPNGRIIEQDIEHSIKEGRGKTSLSREMAKEEGIQTDIHSKGTAIGGRVGASDLKSGNKIYGEDAEIKPLSNIRKVIAKAMQASLQNSAQLTHHMSADARNILAYRKAVKAGEKSNGANITINDVICRCVILALKKHTQANAHFLGDSIKEFSKVHLGFAVDTPRGLMVPVIKNADDLSLEGLSAQLKALADQCKSGSIDPDLLAPDAASFTISNLGNYGVEMFTPVINLPQVGILGVNTIKPQPKDMGDGVYGFVPHIGLSLTYDHRALDGGPATLFLREIKNEIENFK